MICTCGSSQTPDLQQYLETDHLQKWRCRKCDSVLDDISWSTDAGGSVFSSVRLLSRPVSLVHSVHAVRRLRPPLPMWAVWRMQTCILIGSCTWFYQVLKRPYLPLLWGETAAVPPPPLALYLSLALASWRGFYSFTKAVTRFAFNTFVASFSPEMVSSERRFFYLDSIIKKDRSGFYCDLFAPSDLLLVFSISGRCSSSHTCTSSCTSVMVRHVSLTWNRFSGLWSRLLSVVHCQRFLICFQRRINYYEDLMLFLVECMEEFSSGRDGSFGSYRTEPENRKLRWKHENTAIKLPVNHQAERKDYVQSRPARLRRSNRSSAPFYHPVCAVLTACLRRSIHPSAPFHLLVFAVLTSRLRRSNRLSASFYPPVCAVRPCMCETQPDRRRWGRSLFSMKTRSQNKILTFDKKHTKYFIDFFSLIHRKKEKIFKTKKL